MPQRVQNAEAQCAKHQEKQWYQLPKTKKEVVKQIKLHPKEWQCEQNIKDN